MNKRKFIKTSVYATAAGIAVPSVVLSSCSSEKKQQTEEAKNEVTTSVAEFSLPELPYGHGELQPVVDQRTMEIHHGKHHQGYVNKLNAALKKSATEYSSLGDILGRVSGLGDAIRNNAGGHFNHSLFWKVLSPGGSQISSDFNEKLESQFNSFEQFKDDFVKAGLSVFGSGWAWLCVNDVNELYITTSPNQDNPLMDDFDEKGKPILGIDVWEHAYYLKYQNRRGDYLKSIIDIINWQHVEANYQGS